MTSNGKVYLLVFCFVITPDPSMEGSDDYLNIEEKDLYTTVNLIDDSSLKDMLECTLYHESKNLVNENKSHLFWYLKNSKALNKTALEKRCSGKSTMNKSIRVFLFKCLLAQLHDIPNTNCEGFETAVDISTGLSASGPTTTTHTPTTSTPLPSKTDTPTQSAATPAKVSASSDRCQQSAAPEALTGTKTSHDFLVVSVLLNVLQLTGFLLYFWHQRRWSRGDTREDGQVYKCIHLNSLDNNRSSGAAPPPGQGAAASRGGVHSGPNS
uniref:Uncharacterized protein n=1 Tax=Nothobranchius korthausae TaxID=1143690 RepID=A0A1A8F3S9_9TELE